MSYFSVALVALLVNKSPRRCIGLSAAALVMLCALFLNPAYAATEVGRRVVDVLADLHSQGLVFIYNTQIVTDELRVVSEPQASSGVELAREILGAHGLGLLAVAPNTFSVVQPAASNQNKPLTTTRSTTTLSEIVVHTSRYAVTSDAVGSHTLFTQDQVNHLPRVADETLSAVKRLPGAASNGFSSIGPMRGGAPNETGIFLDGMRLYEPFHLKNFLSPVSLLDARLIDSMEVFSGGFPAQYGDRMSSMIDAKSVHPAARYYELGLSVFHLNGLVSTEFADGDASALLSARRSNLPTLVRASENDFGEPSYSDGFARLEYAFSDATRGSLSVLLSRDEITAIQDAGMQTAQAEYRNNYVWATLVHNWSERATSQLLAGFTDVTNNRTGQVNYPGQRVGTVSDLRSFHVASVRIDNDVSGVLGTRSLQQRFGIEARRLTAQYNYASNVRFEQGFPFPGAPSVQTQRAVAPEPEGNEFAAYWDGRMEFGSHWAVQGGLRVDNQTEYGLLYSKEAHTTQWSPRLSVLFAPLPDTKLRASWGRYFQAQGINELQVEDGVDYFYPAQRAEHSIVSIEQALGAGYGLRVEAYRKQYHRPQPRYENLFDPVVLLPEVEFDRVRIAPDSARADGVELLLTARPLCASQCAWSGWFGYTWSRVQDRFADSASVRDVPRSWDQTHAFNLGITWTRGPWVATLADLYHTGWPTTAVALTPQVSIGARNAARFAAYNSLDFRVTRTFALSRGELDVFVEVTNAIASQNACCTEYSVQNVNGSTTLVSETDYWLGLVPSAGVLWRY